MCAVVASPPRWRGGSALVSGSLAYRSRFFRRSHSFRFDYLFSHSNSFSRRGLSLVSLVLVLVLVIVLFGIARSLIAFSQPLSRISSILCRLIFMTGK